MNQVLKSAADAIGNTPLVRLDRLTKLHGLKGTILAKLEYLNPGFSKKDIELSLCGDILSIKAKKVIDEKDSKTLISNQRPNMINKKVRLPIEIKEGKEKIESAKYEDGVLVLVIPVTKKSKNITIE